MGCTSPSAATGLPRAWGKLGVSLFSLTMTRLDPTEDASAWGGQALWTAPPVPRREP